jgi:hypothetical protein
MCCTCAVCCACRLFFTDWSDMPIEQRMEKWDRCFKILCSYPQVRMQVVVLSTASSRGNRLWVRHLRVILESAVPAISLAHTRGQ